jgi:hypothetical protein
MPPQEQNDVRQAGRRFTALPPDRQIEVKRAFQDLRAVPPDQRDTVMSATSWATCCAPSLTSRRTNYESAH